MKLAHPRVAAFEHLSERERAHRLHVIRIEPVDEAVHDLAPGPEILRDRPGDLGQPRHGALEGMAVHIGEARQRDPMPLIRGSRRYVLLERRDTPGLDADAHALRPAVREQCGREPQTRHAA